MMEEKCGKLYLDGVIYRAKYFIGFFESENTLFEVFVYNAEWNKKPHFHICSEDKSIMCAIGIYDAIYVKHKKYKSRLSKQQIIDMFSWLISYRYNEIRKKPDDFTNWENIRVCWNNGYGTRNRPEGDAWDDNFVIPDYMKLLEY